MTKVIDFYFDFISPYSYLAYKKLIKINGVHNKDNGILTCQLLKKPNVKS